MNLPEREFFFLRHGETEYNREGRFQGRTDVPLNRTGIAQAESAASALAALNISRIVSSPAQRVLQTVQPLLQIDDIPLHREEHLMEFFVGSFEGMLVAEIRREHGLGEWESWQSILPDDADVWHEFVPRVCSAVWRWTERHPDEKILVAAHGLVFRALTEVLVGEQLSSRNAEAHHFEPSRDGWIVSPISL